MLVNIIFCLYLSGTRPCKIQDHQERFGLFLRFGAEFDERSLNKILITGPDLTNQIVGVVTRFWQNSTAFMTNIEAMSYQVIVSEHQ